jgi:protein involved in polysaccharide export with SLBB domain
MKTKTTLTAVKIILILAVFTNIFGQSPLSGMNRRSVRGSSLGADGAGADSPFPQSLPGASIGSPSFLTGSFLPPGTILPSDNSIDENEYIIGSGDVFFITVIESPSIRYTAAVDQSGRAFIQNLGMVNIGKTSYSEAKKTISDYIASKIRSPSEVYITLIQTKNATVSFTGKIYSPGSYEFSGTTRLLDVVLAVNDGELPKPAEANMRQVQRTNGDSTTAYDLLAYLYSNDKSQNPYIYPGDHIRINPTTQSVFISGAVKMPETPSSYPLKEGETLREFLTMFTLDNTADTDNIIIYKSLDNSKQSFSASDSHVLSNLDAITVPIRKNQPGIHTVSISGEIASPGHYPIVENVTTARQLIDMAGGPKETGNTDQVAIIRPTKNLPDRLNIGISAMGAVRPERSASISMASASLDYTIIRLVLYNAEKIILEPEDRIIIPKKDKFVYLGGSVKNPGAYPFHPEKDAKYYIVQAGGFSNNADKSNIQVYLKYGDLVQEIEARCVEPGSVIVVPASTQYRFMSQVVLPLITAVATTLSLGLAIITTTQAAR